MYVGAAKERVGTKVYPGADRQGAEEPSVHPGKKTQARTEPVYGRIQDSLLCPTGQHGNY